MLFTTAKRWLFEQTPSPGCLIKAALRSPKATSITETDVVTKKGSIQGPPKSCFRHLAPAIENDSVIDAHLSNPDVASTQSRSAALSLRHRIPSSFLTRARSIGCRVASACAINSPTHFVHARAMLLGHHGASTVGKTLRRPIIGKMTSFDGTSTLAFDAMRLSLAALRGGGRGGGRAIASGTRVTPPSSLRDRLWNANHGIVFSSGPGRAASRSLSTTTVSETEQDVILQSLAVDDYVMVAPSVSGAGDAGTGSAAGSATFSGDRVGDGSPEKPTRKIGVIAAEPVSDEMTAVEEQNEDPTQYELPVTTLQFQMLEDKFHEAKSAESGAPESYWSHTLYRGPEGSEHKIKIHYCKSKHTTERCLQYFEGQKVLGFDIEWKPEASKAQGPKKNVSLIQIASEDRIALFHIALFAKDEISDLVAPTLKRIMEDPEITKVGVAIKADCTRLRKFLNIDSKGIFELSHLYKLIKYSDSKEFRLINKRLVSLATQVQDHLHLPMFKGEVRSSDWSQTLEMDQIAYAASDSYAGVQLYAAMNEKRLALDPVPPLPYHAELNRPIRLADGITIDIDSTLEELEDEPLPSSSRPSRISAKYLESTAETLELDPDFEISTPTTTATKIKATKAPTSPIVQAAATQAEEYRATHPKNRAAPSNLRAYYIWQHNPSMSIEDIAAILRDPPLRTNTVVNYILEAVKLEKLPSEKERLREVLGRLPKEIVQGRFKTLLKATQEK